MRSSERLFVTACYSRLSGPVWNGFSGGGHLLKITLYSQVCGIMVFGLQR